MFAEYVVPDIAPSGTLLGLLQRGRGDGTLHALAAPRSEALAALHHCLRHDPRRDWQIEHRSLYYARLHRDLRAGLAELEAHLFSDQDQLDPREERTGLALSVLGHLLSYGDAGALRLLRRYTAEGHNWQWALDELAVRDDDTGLRSLGPAVLARFPDDPDGDAALAEAMREAYEPRPWRLWEEDPQRRGQRERLARVRERHSFDRWSRQLRSQGPRPGWSVAEVLEWAQQVPEPADGDPTGPEDLDQLCRRREAAAARCLAAVAGPEDRPRLLAAATDGPPAARVAALRHLAERDDPAVLDLVETACAAAPHQVAEAAREAFGRMRGERALTRARSWAGGDDELAEAAAVMLACQGGEQDAAVVLGALRRVVRLQGADAPALPALVDGVGRLAIGCAAPVLRHLYRETASSQLRGRLARALAATDPAFAAGFAVECLWDCEQSTREIAARFAATGEDRVVERLRNLAADPAEEADVQSAVRGRLRPHAAG
ncbi:HEAT repeat domain-containing protein [Streptomyces durbertensis]|uniref:HEAT repeat domain-containing protein n=1 Tax=Streptomyces durbertensis TaxID=2448886 RepID=A0ABR6EIJ0_9ACTN|nr:HEAT repeat domain-containing protein [Streptomyces durbertensis]MBB1245078.1 HEAT repeat domain-containing protein [Streptomyces durbertensis]